MNSVIDEEIIQNHNQAEAFISLFFAGLDAITYIVILTLFGFEFKSIDSPKQKLTMFLLLDGILRIINMYTDSYMQSFVREMLFSLIVTLQFYLSISMLEQIFTDKSNESFILNELQIKNKYLFSFIFFCLVFSFKGFMTSNFLSFMQYICILIVISRNNQFQGRNFINNLPFFIFLYFTIFYVLQLCGLMIDNKLYESYMTMICTIFKEVGKYLNILLLIAVYHSFNKYIKETDFTYDNKHNQNENNKVYKDDEAEEIN